MVKKRCSSDTDGLLLPEEIVFEILVRVPVKSLCRFRCVSSLWRSIISDPHFVSSHFARSSARPKLLMSVPDREKHSVSAEIFLSEIPANRHLVASHRCRISSVMSQSVGISQSVGGLICSDVAPGIQIRNPTTGECITFRRPCSRATVSFLGYDLVEKKHKIVNSLSSHDTESMTEIHILTLGEKEWRRIDPSVAYLRLQDSLCVDGVMHMVGVTEGDKTCFVLFDVRLETFRAIPFPAKFYYRWHTRLIEFGGHVALIDYFLAMYGLGKIRLWILEDHSKEVWSCKSFVPSPLLVEALRPATYIFVGVTSACELVFAPWRSLELSYFYLYHVENASLRKIEVCGFSGGKLAQTRGDNHVRSVCYHVESLQSLRDLRTTSEMCPFNGFDTLVSL